MSEEVSPTSEVPPDASGPDNRLDARAPVPHRRQPRVVTPRGIPVAKCRITLQTEYAQRVFYRTWDHLKADLYVLTVRTRSVGQTDSMAAAIETIISEAFEKTRKDLASDLERTEVLRDQVKLTDMPEWEDRLETEATYSTPRAREFLALIQQTDHLLMLYHALWLAGFANTHDCVRRSQNWQRRLIKITNRLRELAARTKSTLARPAPGVVPSPETAGEPGQDVGAEDSMTVEEADGPEALDNPAEGAGGGEESMLGGTAELAAEDADELAAFGPAAPPGGAAAVAAEPAEAGGAVHREPLTRAAASG